MAAKEFLNQVRSIKNDIRKKQERLERLKETATKITSTLSDMPRPETPDPQRLQSTMAEIADLEREIESSYAKLADSTVDIVNTIASLQSANQISFLFKRYVEGKSWSRIADEADVSESYAFQQHRKAIKEIENSLKNSSNTA